MFPQFFFLILMVSPLNNCLDRHVTTPENKRLDYVNLYDFPQASVLIEMLRTTNSTFIEIASNIFSQQQFVSLKAAVLQYGNIRAIGKRAFNGLSSLILLDLRSNELEELHISAFQGAHSLKVLILAENRIQRVQEESLTGLNDLIYLDLSSNNIRNIHKNSLKYAPFIKYLDISNNPLNVTRTGSFLVSASLAVLRISLGGLQEISSEFFSDLPNVQVLDLSGSKLKVWPEYVLYPLSKLRVLYVDTPLLVNEETFVPATVEKFVQSKMNTNSTGLVINIIENIDQFDATIKDIAILQYLDDEILDDRRQEFGDILGWKLKTVQKVLFFSLFVYLSFVYTMCLSQVFKSFFIQNPYQQVHIDEI